MNRLPNFRFSAVFSDACWWLDLLRTFAAAGWRTTQVVASLELVEGPTLPDRITRGPILMAM